MIFFTLNGWSQEISAWSAASDTQNKIEDTLQSVSEKKPAFINKVAGQVDSLKSGITGKINPVLDSLNSSGKVINIEAPKYDINRPAISKKLNPDQVAQDLDIPDNLVQEIKTNQKNIDKLQTGLEEYADEDLKTSEIPAKIDSKIEEAAQNRHEINELKAAESKILEPRQQMADKQSEIKENAEAINDKSKIKEEFRSKLEEQLVESVANHRQLLENAQQQINKYKKNPYYKIGSVDKNSNSFKHKPLREKLSFGGNFQINNWDPFSINIALQLTYLFLPQWRVGAGAAYQWEISRDRSGSTVVDQSMHGYKSFLEWDGLHKIFLHAGYELLNETEKDVSSEKQAHVWKHYILSGIGKRFSYSSFFKGSVLLLYNFKYEPGSPYPGRWVFRIGAEFTPNFLNKKSK